MLGRGTKRLAARFALKTRENADFLTQIPDIIKHPFVHLSSILLSFYFILHFCVLWIFFAAQRTFLHGLVSTKRGHLTFGRKNCANDQNNVQREF